MMGIDIRWPSNMTIEFRQLAIRKPRNKPAVGNRLRLMPSQEQI
jgi:hypothetical protein